MTDLVPIPEALLPLNDAQAAAVQHRDGPLLILAGAGSGKTRVLTRRVAYMLHTGVAPENILAVTFTNKAAAEMKERVEELVGGNAKDVWVSTFHSSCCRLLRLEAEALGYTRRFAIYDDDDQLRILRQLVADHGYDPKVVVPKAILGRIDHFKNRLLGVEDVVREKRARPTEPLIRLWRDYEEQLRAADAMDFNDLIGKVVELFEQHPDVLDKYRQRFQYVLVDEYQDTNRAQYRMLRLLTSEHRNLAVVGDDDQSIYGFRGADIRNILDFERDFPDARVVRMEQNYRCTERILAVANAVVAKNVDRIAKRLWTGHKLGGARVRFLVHDDPKSEAVFVARAVHQLRRQGIKAGDIAVIYRTNATSQPFELAFREEGLPFKVVGGRQFYARREIRDALSYVRLVTNPADDAAFLRVVNVPPRGIGVATVTRLRDAAQERGEPLLKTARSLATGSDRVAKALDGFVRLADELTEVANSASLPAFVQQVLERSGYVAMLQGEDTPEARGRIENLTQLLRDAAQFDGDDAVGPGAAPAEVVAAWLDRIALTGADEEIPDGGEVTLMTVHNSKGLEYPVVFVVNMVEGQFPHARSAEETGGVDEERRLAYVAFTRAKDRLFVSRCRAQVSFDARRGQVRKEPVAPSRFLFGVPADACEGELPELDGADEGADDGGDDGIVRERFDAPTRAAPRAAPARPVARPATAVDPVALVRARLARQERVREPVPEAPAVEYRVRPVASA
ncbi:MAG: UvrD-helicase domain-containing protein, partial [Alphaproteobacteria bacterium]|nr:UvrD-helicase domain-containing protein [Alphaproteobacteria bacterium]